MMSRRASIFALLIACVIVSLISGCDFQRAKQAQEEISRRLPPLPTPDIWPTTVFTGAPLALIESTLSPALLFHSTANRITLFSPSGSNTQCVPGYVAYGLGGPKVLTNGMPAVTNMLMERWIISWFGSVPGWEDMEVPLALMLQHSPKRTVLDSTGLHLEFNSGAGHIAVMCLYGARALAAQPADLAGLSREEIKTAPKTWEWGAAVPRDPLTRTRFWSSALMRFPFQAWQWRERDLSKAGTLKQHARFAWHSIPIDWQIPHLPMAPVATELAGQWRTRPDGISFQPRCFDMEWPSDSGSLVIVSESDSYSVSLDSDSKPFEDSKQWEESAHLWVNPLRFESGSSGLAWRGTKRETPVSRELGGIRFGEEDLGTPKENRLNSNTRILTWGGGP